jgi:hypothetical protein
VLLADRSARFYNTNPEWIGMHDAGDGS